MRICGGHRRPKGHRGQGQSHHVVLGQDRGHRQSKGQCPLGQGRAVRGACAAGGVRSGLGNERK